MINTENIFNINSDKEFDKIALQVFAYQAEHNAVYKRYLNYLNVDSSKIKSINKIPFMPIDFFKHHKIITGKENTQKIFKSSGTTFTGRSQHYVSDIKLYEKSFNKGFKHFYEDIKDYCILALLPSYAENGDSSLIYMVESLIEQSNNPLSDLYLNDYNKLIEVATELEKQNKKYIILGVSYALLDVVELSKLNLKNAIIMETGGMKGRRKELPKEELHKILKEGFGVDSIHSEYGMTELLSQAYSFGNGIFKTPSWMRILVRDIYDPFSYVENGKSGGINVIDLANINSCCFIETKDLARVNPDNSFSILGRFDNSDIRGCNLLID